MAVPQDAQNFPAPVTVAPQAGHRGPADAGGEGALGAEGSGPGEEETNGGGGTDAFGAGLAWAVATR